MAGLRTGGSDSGQVESVSSDSFTENYPAGNGALSDLKNVIDTNAAQALSYTMDGGSGVITLTDLHTSLSNSLTSLNVRFYSIFLNLWTILALYGVHQDPEFANRVDGSSEVPDRRNNDDIGSPPGNLGRSSSGIIFTYF